MRVPLDGFFSPRSVAVIGATDKAGSVGRTLLANLLGGPLREKIYPVNPKRDTVLGVKAYSRISAAPEKPDLAVIVTPAPTVPGLIRECVASGVKAAVVISAGFKEAGAPGVELEKRILDTARGGGLRVIGPNCLGLMVPHAGLNASFATAMANPGNVGFISQSGALCTAVLDWSFREKVGFSAFVSVGSMLDVGWGDLIDHLGDDPRTQSIILYMESVGDARSFLSAAREVALVKPIIVIKAGRTEAAAKAAASHTGSLAGSDDVLDAAFRRCGVLRVDTIGELFSMTEVLAKQPRPHGPRLAILTNAGGPGVLATDALITRGGELAKLSPETITALDAVLPSHWSHGNPVDILGDADPERYGRAIEILGKDPNLDGLLAIVTPQAMTDPTRVAERVVAFSKAMTKPLLASWMGGACVAEGEAALNRGNIPTFAYPDAAAEAFTHMWQYSANLANLYETPRAAARGDGAAGDRAWAWEFIAAARREGRTILSEISSKTLLAAYGIPMNDTRLATTEEEAVRIAGEMGHPVVLKLHSETITHKTDVGGVRLNLGDAAAVRQAFAAIRNSVEEKAGAGHFLGVSVQKMAAKGGYEVIVGSSMDPQFGPVLLFGAGGVLVEVFKDRSLGLPPLNSTLARRMMERTKIFRALQGVRGEKSADLDLLAEIMVRFSRLVVEQPGIREMDINPLLVSAGGILAVDGRVVLHPREIPDDRLPRAAIRPYPSEYISRARLRDGREVVVRPICAEDEPLVAAFHGSLSDASVFHRYFHAMSLGQRTAHPRLSRICFNDYDRELALVAEHRDPKDAGPKILGIGRLIRITGTGDAEFALLVSDAVQHQGLGSLLMKQMIAAARGEKMARLVGTIQFENHAMQQLCKKAGHRLTSDFEEGAVRSELVL